MADNALVEAFRTLGLDEQRVALVALLPLVRVAWADGEIQAVERERILAVADQLGVRDGSDRAIVEGWLAEAPSGFFLAQAGKLIRGLRARSVTIGEVDPHDIVTHCIELAQAAGGLFGTKMFAFTPSEREALAAVAADLGVEDLDALLTPAPVERSEVPAPDTYEPSADAEPGAPGDPDRQSQ